MVKSQSGPCRRRFLCFIYYYLFLDNILKCSLLHHLAELLSLNFFSFGCPKLNLTGILYRSCRTFLLIKGTVSRLWCGVV